MQAIKCEVCGSSDIIKKDGVFVCQHCLAKYTVEEVKNLLGTVQIDKSSDVENWKILAKRARFEDNAQNAAKYFGLISEHNPNDWEASFFHVYYQSKDCKLAEIPSSISSIRNAIFSTIIMLEKDTSEMEEQDRKNYLVDAFKQIFVPWEQKRRWWLRPLDRERLIWLLLML